MRLITADQPAGDTHSYGHASRCGTKGECRIHDSGRNALLLRKVVGKALDF
jgi:hypothetical protein